MNKPGPKLLDRVRSILSLKRYSVRTTTAYVRWIVGFIKFHNLRHPLEMREPEIEQYLSYLTIKRSISASTQSQALAAILFLYKEVLEINLAERINLIRPFRPQRLPVVLDFEEMHRILSTIEGTPRLIVEILYGTGLRLHEFLNLRIKDVDLHSNRIFVVAGKANRDRITVIPNTVKDKLAIHIQNVQRLHNDDLKKGVGSAYLPCALGRKYKNMGTAFFSQFLFPSNELFHDKTTGNRGRWHIHESTVARIIQSAAIKANINKHVTAHTMRHTFATHLLEAGVNLRIIQELLGHKSPETTMIYTHLVSDKLAKTSSPLDTLIQRINGDTACNPSSPLALPNQTINAGPTATIL